MNILFEIAERTKKRIEEQKSKISLDEIKSMAEELPVGSFLFESALKSSDIAFICEVKKASPSKGLIADDFPYIDIAKEYKSAAAAAISVLTEPYYFMGDNTFLKEISATVSIPTLRKDFVIDDYMIYEAKTLGASAVLLICSLLEKETLAEYIELSHRLGLSALVEAHDEEEIETAVSANARVIGVNNRNLKTFDVDMSNSLRLRSLVPDDVTFVSESGIRTAADVEILRQNNVNAVLVGESLMRSPDKKAALAELRTGSPLRDGSVSGSNGDMR